VRAILPWLLAIGLTNCGSDGASHDGGAGGAGGAGGGDGGDNGPDMATGIVFTGATDQIVFELEPLMASFSVADLVASDLALTATGVPSTATFTPTGASATLTWTPTNAEAGDYPITLVATSASDPTRTASQSFVVHVKNTIDPMLNPFGISPDQLVLSAVGDVDGDGAADFAYCTINIPASAPAQYSIQIVYGDKSGLPTARPYPVASRTRTIAFNAPAGTNDGTSAFNFVANCYGGDFDGDGHSDVVLADPFFVGGTPNGTYWLVYGTPRADTAAPVLLQFSASAGDNIGNNLFVGDWNGDGLVDFGSVYLPTPSASAQAHVYVWRGAFPRATGTLTPTQFNEPLLCGNFQLIGFAAADGSNGPGGKKAHPLAWFDGGVQPDGTVQTSGTCGANNGGITLLSAGININTIKSASLPRASLPPLAICDVNADGKDDLLLLTQDPTSHKWTTSITYGSASGWTSPIDTSKAAVTAITANSPRQGCWPSAFGPSRYVVGDPGGLTSQGFLTAGTVYLFSTDAGGVPTLSKTLTNFSSDTNFTGFGADLIAPGDVNGDGKLDFVIGYQSTFAGPHFAWLVYGR
jgi:hypothetical protein